MCGVVLSPGFLAWVFHMLSTQVYLLSDNYVSGTVPSALCKSSHLICTKNSVKVVSILFWMTKAWRNSVSFPTPVKLNIPWVLSLHWRLPWIIKSKGCLFLSDWEETKKNAQTLVGIQAERDESSSFLIDCLLRLTILVFGIENVFRLKEFKYSFHGATFGNHPFHLHSGNACHLHVLFLENWWATGGSCWQVTSCLLLLFLTLSRLWMCNCMIDLFPPKSYLLPNYFHIL